MKRPSHKAKAIRRVCLVDDHPVVRRGLAQLINQEADLQVCGEADDLPTALALVRRARPDLVLVDITLKGRSGLELIKMLNAEISAPPALVVSMHDETLYAERALRAGARGYVMKEEAPEGLLTAMRKVLDGQVHLSDRMAARVLQQAAGAGARPAASPAERLSDRELEVFRLLGRGRGTRQIAETLNLSVKTVETYRAHLMAKLQLQSAPELIRHAVEWVHAEGG
ncbi:MAG: response regulator transcription factor [Candidatus Omnitrophica bacterium]|nr:response regulator transcription factor [Candidatus Omnitrophota bacterium]